MQGARNLLVRAAARALWFCRDGNTLTQLDGPALAAAAAAAVGGATGNEASSPA